MERSLEKTSRVIHEKKLIWLSRKTHVVISKAILDFSTSCLLLFCGIYRR